MIYLSSRLSASEQVFPWVLRIEVTVFFVLMSMDVYWYFLDSFALVAWKQALLGSPDVPLDFLLRLGPREPI
jgi:hypothetical protein